MRSQAMIKEINEAIGAHGMWKLRLRTAIRTGQSDVSSQAAGCDDKCAFGQWLYGGTLDAATRAGMPYQVVRRLHAEFHRSAGSILQHVESSRRETAEQALAGDYTARSEKLIRALNKWKNELVRGTMHDGVLLRAG